MKTWDTKQTAGRTDQDFVQMLGLGKNSLIAI
jgi:hypothetical protein